MGNSFWSKGSINQIEALSIFLVRAKGSIFLLSRSYEIFEEVRGFGNKGRFKSCNIFSYILFQMFWENSSVN